MYIKPWMTKALKDSICKKQRLFTKWCNSQNANHSLQSISQQDWMCNRRA